jgi:hypothetical protein
MVSIIFSNGCSSSAIEVPVAQPVQVLEIRSDAEGMIDVVGKSLYFRLASDGTAEFEIDDDAKKSSSISNAAEVNILRRIRLNDREKNSVMEAIALLSTSQLENKYRRKCCCTDTLLDLNLSVDWSGRQRSVVLSDFCDITDITNEKSEAAEQLPTPLIKLLRTVDNLRWKYKKVSG